MNKTLRKITILIVAVIIAVTPIRVNAEEYTEVDEKTADFQAVFEFIMDNYVGEDITEEQLFEAAMNGIFNELDAYSEFYTLDEADAFYESVSGEFVGIGIEVIKEEKWLKVISPIPSSPADKAGIIAEDNIIEVDGVSIENLTLQEAVDSIKGEPGTTVTLTILRGEEELVVDVIRDTVKVSAVKPIAMNKLFPDLEAEKADRVRYIEITSINANVANDMEQVITSAKDNGVEYLILDLRNNPGGYVDQAVELSSMLIPEGPIVHFVNKLGEKKTYVSNLKEAPFEIVVLTNENTASAAEFIAAAVKESKTGIVVGETTYGKGVAQYFYTLSNKYAFKLTMEEFLSRNENKINNVGVKPNITIDIPNLILSENRLYPNEESVQVYNMESILKYLGYDVDQPDMFYDNKTKEAVFKFQQDVSLYPYGVCDFSTQSRLNEVFIQKVTEKDRQLDKALEYVLGKMNQN